MRFKGSHKELLNLNVCMSIIVKIASVLGSSSLPSTAIAGLFCVPAMVFADVFALWMLRNMSTALKSYLVLEVALLIVIMNVELVSLKTITCSLILLSIGWKAAKNVDVVFLIVQLYEGLATDRNRMLQQSITGYCLLVLLMFFFFDVRFLQFQSTPANIFYQAYRIVYHAVDFADADDIINQRKAAISDYDSSVYSSSNWIITNMEEQLLLKTKAFSNVVIVIFPTLSPAFVPFYNFTLDEVPQFDRQNAINRFSNFHDFIDVDSSQPSSETKSELLMPFLHSQILKHSVISRKNHFTSTTYPPKALLSIICGIYPLNVNYNLETGRQLPAECLPHILRAHKYKSTLMHSANLRNDDELRLVKELLGFDNVVHYPDIKDRFPDLEESLKGEYSDMDLLPFIETMFEDHKLTGQNFCLTLSLSATRHPWKIPAKYRHLYRHVSTDDESNRYMTSLIYADTVLRELFLHFEKFASGTPLMESTAFVITGLNGLSFSPESVAAWKKASFETPFYVLAKNREKLAGDESLSHHIDIMPTILDLLAIKSISLGDGQSMVRKMKPRPLICTSSPGNKYLIISDTYFRLIVDPIPIISFEIFESFFESRSQSQYRGMKLFDMRNDPDEHQNLVGVVDGDAQLWEWFKEAMMVAFHYSHQNRQRYGFSLT